MSVMDDRSMVWSSRVRVVREGVIVVGGEWWWWVAGLNDWDG